MKPYKSYVQNIIFHLHKSNGDNTLKSELIIELIKIRDGREIDMPSIELISRFESQMSQNLGTN